MDIDEVRDEADRITLSLEGAERRTAFRRLVDSLAPGETGRAEFACELADYLALDGQLDEARQAYRDAIADGGLTSLDPRTGLLSVELAAGDEEASAALLSELLAATRTGSLGAVNIEWVGDLLEEQGRLKEAHRWFTIPLRDVDPDDLDQLPPGCLNGRYRVRRALDLPVDRYDEAALEVQAFYREQSAPRDLQD